MKEQKVFFRAALDHYISLTERLLRGETIGSLHGPFERDAVIDMRNAVIKHRMKTTKKNKHKVVIK